MTQLILVRHGETLWNREKRMQGQTDTVLSETGRQQADALGRRLSTMAFAALYSSDLLRAWDTAQAIAAQTGRTIAAESRLRERMFGIFEGLTHDEIAERYPDELARFQSRDPDYVVPGGESAHAFHARCLPCLQEIAERHLGGEVVVVTHGLVLDAIYRAARGMAPGEPRTAPLLNGSLNVFRFRSGAWRLEIWGDVAHLAPETVTRYQGRGV
jgi:probable phosphoglycerate mutase